MSERAGEDELRERVRKRMAQEGIPVGSDDPIVKALGAPPLPNGTISAGATVTCTERPEPHRLDSHGICHNPEEV